MQCDIRVVEDTSALLSDTKCILLLGQDSMHKWLPDTRKNTLGELRGSVLRYNDIPAIASYFPQDAADIKAYEKQLNPLSKDYETDDESGEDDADDYDSIKRHGRTSRSNYSFWLRADTKKAKTIIQTGIPPREYPEPDYKIYPNSDEVIKILTQTKGEYLWFDMETDYEEQNLQCFSFSFDGRTIYCVPMLDYNYHPAYSNYHNILRSLAVSIRDNTIVAHNGAAFDFLVLAYKYHIAINKSYDTMLAMHRCFPDVEKSLGHCTSYWTWERFHKDEDSQGYMTREQMMSRLKYCGKDVYTMFLIHKAIEKYARTIPGLQHSIDSAMRYIRPYLISTIQGLKYNQELLDVKRKENDRLMMQYIRIIELLIGKQGMIDTRRIIKGKVHAFPGSNVQCCEYFHNILGYPVVARGKVRKDGTRQPSLAKKAMYKLRLKQDNPVIDFCNVYRSTALETSTPLGFIPWRGDNNEIIDWRTYGRSPDEIRTNSSPAKFIPSLIR